MLGCDAQQVQDRGVELAFFRQPFAQFTQLMALGQASKPEEVAGLLEVGMVGEIVDIDAAVGEYTLFAIDIADARRGGNHALQTFGRVRCGYARHTPSQELGFRCRLPGSKLGVATDCYTPKSGAFQPPRAAFPGASGILKSLLHRVGRTGGAAHILTWRGP